MMDLTKINMPKFFFFVYNKKNMELDTTYIFKIGTLSRILACDCVFDVRDTVL